MRIYISCIILFALAARLSSASEPNDPDFALQWGLRNVGQEVLGILGIPSADVDVANAWTIHSGTVPVVVAIIGRGVDPHPEFAERLLEGRAFVGDLYDTRDTCRLDTPLAGIIAATSENAAGIAGVHGRVRVMPIRVQNGCGASAATTAKGLIWAVDHDADVILLAVQFAEAPPDLENAVAYAVSRDVMMVAPVGSSGDNEVLFPAAFDDVLAVAATTNRDEVSQFSNSGDSVDLAAPGSGIWSTRTGGGYGYVQEGWDTPAAAAFVAGVAALIRSYAPQLSAAEVMNILVDSSDDIGPPGWDTASGSGRVNAARALALATAPAIRFEPVDAFPSSISPAGGSAFDVRVVGVAEDLVAGSTLLRYRTDAGNFLSHTLVSLGDSRFRAEFTEVECGATVEYFLEASGSGGTRVTFPLDAPTRVKTAWAMHTSTLFADDFEDDRGWSVEVRGENTLGSWERVVPVETIAQPGFDHSSGASETCFLTGQYRGGSPGLTDVDGGPVSLVSPVIDLDTQDAEVRFAAWFYWSGAGEEDFLTVELSRDGGSNWHVVETISGTGTWEEHSFRLGDFAGVTGDQLRVRFSTADDPVDSLTEAAIDDFEVLALRCVVPPGDTNGDGIVDLSDFARGARCMSGPGTIPSSSSCVVLDLDVDRDVDLIDLSRFQNAFSSR